MARINTGMVTSLYDTGPGSSLSVPDPIFLFTLGRFEVVLIFLKGNQPFFRLFNTTSLIHSAQINTLDSATEIRISVASVSSFVHSGRQV